MNASRTSLAFLVGLALGAGGAMAIERLRERSAGLEDGAAVAAPEASSRDERLDARPTSTAPPPSEPPSRPVPVPTPSSAASRTAKHIARFDESIARGDVGEAVAALDEAYEAGGDWEQTEARLLRLAPAERERWILRHRVTLNPIPTAMLLFRAGCTTAGLAAVERILATGDPVPADVVRLALDAGGDAGLALLGGRASQENPLLGLAVAEWLSGQGRADEAVRRVAEDTSRRAPTPEEIAWLGEHDARASLAAARSLADRRRSPKTLLALGQALERTGDLVAAFDAFEAALRAGLSADEGAMALARLDSQRASGVLMELYGGRGDDSASEALGVALLRSGRNAEAARELLRSALENGGADLLPIVRLDPAAAAATLARELGDVDAVPATQADRLLAYGAALRRAGRRDDALRVLRVAAEKPGFLGDSALVEMLRCDVSASKEFVEARLSRVDASYEVVRIGLLGLLGRKAEAAALVEKSPGDLQRIEALGAWDPDHAIRELQHTIADEVAAGNEPDDARAALASLLADLGRASEARAEWDRVSREGLLELSLLVKRAAQR